MARASEIVFRQTMLALILGAWLLPTATLAQTPSVSLTEVLRLGNEEAGGELLLGGPRDIAVNSKGQLYVADKGWNGVLVLSGNGILEGVIGREGRGPGEFERVSRVYIDARDSVYVWDSSMDRLTTFSPYELSYVHSFVVPREDMFVGRFVGATDRGFLFSYFGIPGWGLPEGMENLTQIKLLDRSGNTLMDSVAYLPSQEMLVHNDGGVLWGRDLPFASSPHFVLTAGQVLFFGSSSAIRLVPARLGGGSHKTIEVPYTPVQVSRVERERSIKDQDSRPLRRMARSRLPEVKPAFTRVVADDEGRFWISLSRAEKDTAVKWLVVDRSGMVVAQTELPKEVTLYTIRAGRAYGRMDNPDAGAPMVVAWTVEYGG